MLQSTPTPLLFGNDIHVAHADPAAFGASMSMLWKHLNGCDSRPGQQGFCSRTAALQLPGMSFMAIAVSSLRVDVTDNARTLIAFPVHGHARLRIQGRRLRWGAGSGCLFVPAGSGPQQVDAMDQNVLVLQMDQRALEDAARAVLGLERGEPVNLGFDDPRVLTSCVGSSPAALARYIGATIDPHASQPHLLHRLGVQDFVYRQLVLLFRPDWRAASRPAQHGGPHRRRAIDRVCDAILADLQGHYTVSDLALLGGMSVRALQYAFRSRFGHSPMQWLRDQRLQHMRQRLLDGAQGSIAQMALDCGFATASGFSAFYRRRYGESPAATRAGRR